MGTATPPATSTPRSLPSKFKKKISLLNALRDNLDLTCTAAVLARFPAPITGLVTLFAPTNVAWARAIGTGVPDEVVTYFEEMNEFKRSDILLRHFASESLTKSDLERYSRDRKNVIMSNDTREDEDVDSRDGELFVRNQRLHEGVEVQSGMMYPIEGTLLPGQVTSPNARASGGGAVEVDLSDLMYTDIELFSD